MRVLYQGLMIAISFLGMLLCLITGAFFYLLYIPTVDLSPLTTNFSKPTLVLDDKAHVWAQFAQTAYEPVTIQQIPQSVIQAFVAAEDHAFFSHKGVSFKGIARSLLINFYYGKRVQGASTITQQLVRLLYFDAQKTFMRKIKEQGMALLVECHCTKEQILCAYLNTAYFGAGIYGIAAASKIFWNISVEQLTIAQAATLAGMVKSPMHYCPLLNPLSAQQRRNVVLYVMHSLGMISKQEYEQAKASSLGLVTQEPDECCAPHLKELIRQWAEQTFGKEAVYSKGLTIQTTLSRAIQQEATNALKQQVNQLRKTLNPEVDGGLITIETSTGAIKAYVGGYDFGSSQFNRCRAYRQLGSLFKPLVYSVALERGYTFADVMVDEPITISYDLTQWQPGNANEMFKGTMTLAYALSHSNNIVAIKTLLAVGIGPVVNRARQCHFPYVPVYPSLALGCLDATLEHAVAAFNIFPNHGFYVAPYYIAWVKDNVGNIIWKHTVKPEKICTSVIADKVLRILCLGMERLSKQLKSWIKCESCGKTGTPNESRTCFFIGSTPEYTTGIMIGCDNNQSLGNRVFAVRTAFPVWYKLHKTMTFKQNYFSFDPSLKKVWINAFSGQETSERDPDGLEIFM